MYHVIDDENISFDRFLPNGNLINFSMLHELYVPERKLRSFSIKYVFEGTEHYTINGKRFSVKDNQYLLANNHCEGSISIESKDLVKGVCIDIAPEIISDVISHILRPDAPLADPDLERFFTTSDFLENHYRADQTRLGDMMQCVGKALDANPYDDHRFTNEFYYDLAERIVADHIPVLKQLQSITVVKQSTRKDLLRRLMRGKQYMDERFADDLSIADIASFAGLSEYHFIRLFKTAYSQTPYQYLLHKRLETANCLLKEGHRAISDVAEMSGFSDSFGFSKAFRKHFGVPPSQAHG